MPPKTFPVDTALQSSIGPDKDNIHMSRESEPLPHPPGSNPYRRDVFPGYGLEGSLTHGRSSTSSLQGIPTSVGRVSSSAVGGHQFDYAMLQQPPSADPNRYPPHAQQAEISFGGNDATFSGEGYIPSYQEADRLFNPNDTTTHFNESRLSFGMMPSQLGRHSQDPMYETLSKYKAGEMGRWSSSFSSNNFVPQTRNNLIMGQTEDISATSDTQYRGQFSNFARKVPPPLPPKPRMAPSRSTQSDIGIASHEQYFAGVGDRRPSGIYLGANEVDIDERGYSVSFV